VIAKLIGWSARHVVLVLMASAVAMLAGLYGLTHVAVDALPDLSDTQVIIATDYPGQAPQVVEDQVTFPLTSAMLSVPHARVVRGFSNFGVSFVYVIFDEGTDIYWARTRVLEYLSAASGRLPAGVTPSLGPDATGVGWVYQYALVGAGLGLSEQRALQDWHLRFALSRTPGIAEIASVGGYVKQYSITVDPQRLKAFGISLAEVRDAVRASNRDVGGRTIELSETEFMVRGRGYLTGTADLEAIVLASRNGTPVRIADIARVEIVPDERRGIAELNGDGEVAIGIAIQRYGADTRAVIEALKVRLAEVQASLPSGIGIVPVYDRSEVIGRAIDTLTSTLIEESLVVAFICFVFLLHARSALVAVVTLPVGILMAFGVMALLGIGSNIMSLGGIAIAIGAMVDAAIVMIENAHKRLEHAPAGSSRIEVLVAAAQEVGPSLFFGLLIITVSFLPIFALEAQEGRLFHPLAFTKTLSMAAAALLSVTLVPALMVLFVRGRIRPEAQNPLNRLLIWLYRPLIRYVLRAKLLTLFVAAILLALTAIPILRLGTEFMPNLNEGTLLYMPTTLPGLSVTKAAELLQTQDRIIKEFPEVQTVWGKAGRAQTATDPAPLEMSETVITLKPEAQWRPGVTIESLVAEMDAALQFPGVSNAWTMPIKARIDMLSTGIRTPVGIKLFGPDLTELERLSREVEAVVRTVPGTTSAYAERVTGGYFLDIVPDRDRLARYGLNIDAVQDTIALTLGAEPVTTTIEGRERYGVVLRIPRDSRSDPHAIATDVLISLPSGGTVPLGEVARISRSRGPTTIRTEDGQLAVYVYVDLRGRDLGSFVADAQRAVAEKIAMPEGYRAVWSGQFEYLARAEQRLNLVIPATLLLVVTLLYANFRRISDTLTVLLSLPFALIGGFWLMDAMGFNMSVASAVGFIALAGVAAETGVMMLLYLRQALSEHRAKAEAEGRRLTQLDLQRAIMEGAVERVRPKMMTVAAIMAGLVPILWSHGIGSEVTQRIAVPMIGGMLTSTALTLLVIPVLFALIHRANPPTALEA